MVDRAQLLPVAHRARRDVRRLHLPRLLDRHRHAGEVHAGAPRHHGRPVPGAAVCRRAAGARLSRRRRARRRRRDRSRARASSTRAPSSRPARASARTRCSGTACHVEEGAVVDGAILWADEPRRPGSVDDGRDPRPPLPRRPRRHRRRPGAVLGDKSVVTDYSQALSGRLTDSTDWTTDATMNPDIFKAYDVRGALPAGDRRGRSREQIGRGFVTLSQARSGLRVSRDMRLSSPSLAAAFIEGALRAGRRRRRLRDDGDRHAVLRRRHATKLDGGAQITASHNPDAVQRHQDGARARRCRSAATPASARSAT